MDFFITAFLFFLPAGIANMTPIFAARVPGLRNWNAPLDFGRSYRGKQILGANKTWRGLITGTLMGGITAMLIHNTVIASEETNVAIVFLGGCLLGFGALFGDAVESFFKRQRGIASGESWFPFDQTDYIIGGLIFVYPLSPFPWVLMLAILVIYFGAHLLASYIGYLMGLKAKPI